jgi:hypothetical protein
MRIRFAGLVVILMTVCALGTSAQDPAPPTQQEKPAPPPASRNTPNTPPVPVKVTVVLGRYQGEKRISSMPYVLGVMASGWGQGPRTRLRMGTDVPVVQTIFGGGDNKAIIPQSSYSYRNIGTSIDCNATYEQSSGVFQLVLTVSDSSIGLDTGQKKSGSSAIAENIPAFRTFSSEFTAVLKDGQTTQYTSATDPVTGEVTKIDVTLNVMK